MSDPTMPIAGSIEVILPDGENQGLAVKAATEDDIPTLLRVIFGLTAATAPATAPAEAHAAWETQTDIGDPVTVILWPTSAFDFTDNGLPRDGDPA